MKKNMINYKFAVFSALVLSMIIPFTGINIAHATQTTNDPYHIGTVADGTYNETAALQRVTQLTKMSDAATREKVSLELELSKATDPIDVNSINSKITSVQRQIDQITQEFNTIQAENWKLYYMEPTLLTKYNTAKDVFIDSIQTKYWEGKTSFEDKRDSFPIVGIEVNSKQKSVEITLWDGIKNSPKADQYIATIRDMMPKDIPWFVSYSEYPAPAACTSRTVGTCSPSIGGIQIGVKVDATHDRGCTLGYDAKRTSDNALGFVTAGHCENGLTGNDVHQPAFSTTIGTASTTVYSSGTDCDCGWVKLNTGKTISDAIFNTGTTTYTPTSVTAQSGQTAGTMVKLSGAVSGIQTGSITSQDTSITYGDGVTVMHVVNATLSLQCGDSGSPVTNSAGTSLFGDASGGKVGNMCQLVSSYTYYSPEDRAAADLGVTIITG